jgi:hypothetical protein
MRSNRMSVMNWQNAVMTYFNVFEIQPKLIDGNAGY